MYFQLERSLAPRAVAELLLVRSYGARLIIDMCDRDCGDKYINLRGCTEALLAFDALCAIAGIPH